MVRFAAVVLVAEEVLFFRLPFKPVHLLPVIAAVALLAGAAPLANRRWLAALVVAQLVGAFVGTTLAAPDRPDGAESGTIELHLTSGVLLNDVRCRLRDDDRRPLARHQEHRGHGPSRPQLRLPTLTPGEEVGKTQATMAAQSAA